MTFALRAGVASDVGGHRDVNQDAAFVAAWGVGVADGVGGGPAGEIASSAFVHRLVAGGSRVLDAPTLAGRIHNANGDLGAHVRRDPSLTGMATTFTGIWFAETAHLLLAHTGDSRAYLLRDDELIRQTRDDSLVQALVDQGLVREEDAMGHPHRNLITASLRGEESDPVRVRECISLEGDRWMLCSDGVSDYLADDIIADVLRDLDEPQQAADALVALALEAGSLDNVTAAVADVHRMMPLSAAVRFVGAAAALCVEGIGLAG